MAINKNKNGNFFYNNADKSNKNFMYSNLTRANCYNCDFSNSHFEFSSLRGAHFKKCNFYRSNLKGAEFIGSNLKGSKFKEARFEDTVFEGANLTSTDFSNAKFKNTIFVGCDLSTAKNLNLDNKNIKIFDSMPELNISEELQKVAKSAMENEFIKKSRVLDTKYGNLNGLSFMILSEKFDENTLIEGMHYIKLEIDKEFHTLSYIIRLIEHMYDVTEEAADSEEE
ncbi:pentapeptide repeat-containing protein [Clostridium butyricum]